jgi:hypothetical protein
VSQTVRPCTATAHPIRLVAFAALLLAGCAGEGATASVTPGGSAAPSPSALAASASAAVSKPAVHPEGTILFLRTTGNDLHAYYTANADGTDERQLTQPGEYCCNNRISPDRTQIIVMPGGAPPTPVSVDLASAELYDPGSGN